MATTINKHNKNGSEIGSVLFDLDGTLLDTAPDMTNALNSLLDEEGLPPLSHELCRDYVSQGSVAMVTLGFGAVQNGSQPRSTQANNSQQSTFQKSTSQKGTVQDEALFEQRRLRFLALYEKNLCVDTKLFEGMEETLSFIEQQGIPWGVVTNKPAFLTDPLLEQLGLSQRACSVISGDTIKQRKPDPAPLYLAANGCKVLATDCIYVGDAERDIEAGNRANMQTLIASYGYIDESQRPVEWGANGVVEHPSDIIEWLYF